MFSLWLNLAGSRSLIVMAPGHGCEEATLLVLQEAVEEPAPLSAEQQSIADRVVAGHSVFFTGCAGAVPLTPCSLPELRALHHGLHARTMYANFDNGRASAIRSHDGVSPEQGRASLCC